MHFGGSEGGMSLKMRVVFLSTSCPKGRVEDGWTGRGKTLGSHAGSLVFQM